ncbi:ADP-ribose pyrophosphatase YjhB (NUDIX family) [Agitococcus lubricus]|uniref:Phosphatase NudJ n=2 Tax=Agitococcus lubricus TaxID=1077255 RepID=A0A2T5IYV7_9GAMM|nr:ADP-ribose pyrophosphatase YjhB (NUDIX family) [Agitococcus lubricus]
MTWQPHVTVAVVVERDGKFLLVEEETLSSHVDVYNQPAGHVEQGETLIVAAKREALEETGWEVEPTHLLGVYTYTPPNSPDMSYYRFCFIAKAIHHYERPLDEGIIRAVWLTLDELIATERARSPLVIQCIRDYLKGQAYPLALIYEHPIA